MTRHYALVQVDVFTRTPLAGNPLAVLPDARGLSDAEMQAIAREMNLSETTFVLPDEGDGADYRVRIFTPGSELPFAGHPTIGTAHALLEGGFVERSGDAFTLTQRTLAGTQTIDVEPLEGGRVYTMTQPTPQFSPGPPVARIAEVLRVKPEAIVADPLTVSVGVAWHVAALANLDVVRDLEPNMDAIARLERETDTAITVFCREAEDRACDVRVRSFAPGAGIPEDPVCGSGNGCVGAYLAHTGLARAPLAYEAEQGVELGRPGRVRVRVDAEGDAYRVRVGGEAVTLLRGELVL